MAQKPFRDGWGVIWELVKSQHVAFLNDVYEWPEEEKFGLSNGCIHVNNTSICQIFFHI